MPPIATPTDAEICGWFEAQTEETLRDLFDRFDACTPRECWHAFFRPPPANTAQAACLPAPASAGQGVGTHQRGYFMFAVLMFLMTACTLVVGLLGYDCERSLQHGFVSSSCHLMGWVAP